MWIVPLVSCALCGQLSPTSLLSPMSLPLPDQSSCGPSPCLGNGPGAEPSPDEDQQARCQRGRQTREKKAVEFSSRCAQRVCQCSLATAPYELHLGAFAGYGEYEISLDPV